MFLPKANLGSLFLMFGAAGVLGGCSFFDATDRAPSTGGLPGILAETALSDAELSSRDLVVMHRFRTVPLVLLGHSASANWSGVTKIQNSDEMNALFQLRSSQNVSRLVQPPGLSLVSNPGRFGNSYTEAGFASVLQRMQARRIGLAPVKVAIVDTGVVPASSAIRLALVNSSNLSVDTDTCSWRDHATAIASIFVGVFTGGVSECNSVGGVEAFRSPAFAPNVKIDSIKISFQNDRGNSSSTNTMRADLLSLQVAVALDDAVADGAEIVNLSIAYDSQQPNFEASLAERYVMAKAAERGVIFVAAAGNQGSRIGETYYPATYDLDNIVVVGAHTPELRHFGDSNYGDAVDITAQGNGILASTVRGGAASFDGTSLSVPMVVSALALHKGLNAGLDYRSRIRDLFASANPTYAAENAPTDAPISRYGRLDVASFLKNIIP